VSSGEKTEAPTPKRREDVRKRGNVPKSVELNSVLALVAGTMVLRSVGGSVLDHVLNFMGNSFRSLTLGEWTADGMTTYGSGLSMFYLSIMAPLFLTLMLVGLAVNPLQSGLVLSAKPLLPDFSRIDPFKGFKRIFSQRSLVELIKSVAKLGIIGYITYQGLQDKYLQIVSLSGTDIRGTAGMIAGVAMDILLKASLALFAVAALDYGYQRWEYQKNLRMTKHEVREELRQSEGDPKVRSRIRQQQRRAAAGRMMHEVPKSDVVVTNPTHLAVALQYRPESMRSPKVTAKGQLLVAERIKDVAREYGVPVLENKPLAQVLFKSVEIGAEIPPALYHTVAEVLAFIYSLKRQRRTGGQGLGS